jgi:transglutaminase-like putative cysteine protease
VCQDLTHIFISAARSIGIPARYISGHFHRDDGVVDQEAGHAWAEAFVPDLGWVAFDAANGVCATDAHVRIAAGLDYLGRRRCAVPATEVPARRCRSMSRSIRRSGNHKADPVSRIRRSLDFAAWSSANV